MTALVGVVIGGLISLVTTLTVEVLRGRHEQKHRWDDDALAAVEHFIEIASRTIGALYDEGRARFTDDPDSPRVVELDRAARTHMDMLRVAHARARLTMPSLDEELERYRAALDGLKKRADSGFAPDDEIWKEQQAQLIRHLDAVISKATTKLKIGPV